MKYPFSRNCTNTDENTLDIPNDHWESNYLHMKYPCSRSYSNKNEYGLDIPYDN